MALILINFNNNYYNFEEYDNYYLSIKNSITIARKLGLKIIWINNKLSDRGYTYSSYISKNDIFIKYENNKIFNRKFINIINEYKFNKYFIGGYSLTNEIYYLIYHLITKINIMNIFHYRINILLNLIHQDDIKNTSYDVLNKCLNFFIENNIRLLNDLE